MTNRLRIPRWPIPLEPPSADQPLRRTARRTVGTVERAELRGRVARFTTSVDGRRRTTGVVAAAWTPDEAETLMRPIASQSDRGTDCATGKIVFAWTEPSPHIAVRQLLPDGTQVATWCGNATAAGLAALGTPREPTAVIGPGGRAISVKSTGDPFELRQTWTIDLDSYRPSEVMVCGIPIVLSHALNSYVILESSITECSLGGLEIRSGNAKVALVDSSEHPARVAFRTSQGWHPTAPLTGLIELVVASRWIPWVHDALKPGQVLTRNGSVEVLPIASGGSSHVAVEVPARGVRLDPIEAIPEEDQR